MSDPVRRAYEFGPFRLDPAEGQLWRGAEEMQLAQKSFKVLLLLLENSGHVVDKAELMEKVWPDTFVDENRLADNVSTLRKALGDDPKSPRYIKTVPGRGYRFVADVREVVEEPVAVFERTRASVVIEQDDAAGREAVKALPSAASQSEALAAREDAVPAVVPRPEARRWSRPAILAAVGVTLLVAAAAATYKLRTTRPGPAPSPRSLAVMPFKRLGAPAPGGEDEYLGQGLADALITKLSNVRQIIVRPTSAVLKYAGAERPDLVSVAREQRVDAVLEGSVQRSGERVRVTVQLVGASDGAPLWAETFDEKFTDMFAVQDAISARVAEALRLRLSSDEERRLARRQTQNPEAYQAYLRGRYHWNRRTREGMQRAVEYLSQSVRLDPSYALAHAALADAYVLLPEYTDAPFRESMARAKEAALSALELDDSLAEAHVSLAYIKQTQWDWQGVEEEYRRGLGLNPNYATGHQWYSEYLIARGRMDEALAEIRRAQQLDPLSLIFNVRVGMTYYYARRYDEAIEHLRKALEFNPDFILTNVFLYGSLYEKGAHREAIPHLVRGFFHPYPPEERARIERELLSAYDAAGAKGMWQKARDLMESGGRRDYNYAYNLSEVYMRLGDRDAAFHWLDRAADVMHPAIAALKVEPAMDVLRPDPRFRQLLLRTNLTE